MKCLNSGRSWHETLKDSNRFALQSAEDRHGLIQSMRSARTSSTAARSEVGCEKVKQRHSPCPVQRSRRGMQKLSHKSVTERNRRKKDMQVLGSEPNGFSLEGGSANHAHGMQKDSMRGGRSTESRDGLSTESRDGRRNLFFPHDYNPPPPEDAMLKASRNQKKNTEQPKTNQHCMRRGRGLHNHVGRINSAYGLKRWPKNMQKP
jgi:hypothetical protein